MIKLISGLSNFTSGLSNLTVVCLPGYFRSLITSDSIPVEPEVEPEVDSVGFQLDTSSISAILDSVSGYIWKNYLTSGVSPGITSGPESSSGIGHTSGHIFNFRFRYQGCFQPRDQNARSIWYHQRC